MKDTKIHILDCAKKVLVEKGFHGATMDEIAKEAGVAKGTIYLYFKSKAELYVKIMEREFDYISATFSSIMRSANTLFDKLGLVIDFLLRYMKENRDFFFSLMYEPPLIKLNRRIHKRYMKRIDAIRGEFVNAIEKGIKDGEIVSEDPGVLVDFIFGAIIRPIINLILRKREDIEPERVKKTVLNALREGIFVKKGG